MATPNRKKAEENAPSRKYFMAASCDSSRRRRARPHSRYSGSDSTSSATNIVSRSLEAGNSIIPPTANIVSGKISVCCIPAARPSRSSGLPGVAAACAANGLSLVSAMSSRLDEGQHHDRALDEQGGPVDPDRAHRGDVARAAVGEDGAIRGHHDGQDERGGQRAQREHQLDGAAHRTRQERLEQDADHRRAEDDQHRRELPVLDVRRADGAGRRIGEDRDHGAIPFCAAVVAKPAAGWAGTGSVTCTCAIVTRTAGLMMSSTGLG